MERKARFQCRLWWPLHLSFQVSRHSSSLLFGWASHHPESVDVVVAAACGNAVINSHFSDSLLQTMLKHVTERLPREVQGESKFSLIGECISTQESGKHSNSVTFENSVLSDHEDKRPPESFVDSQGEPGCSKVEDHHASRCSRSGKYRATHRVTSSLGPRNGLRICENMSIPATWIELSIEQVIQAKSLLHGIPCAHSLRVQGSSREPNFHIILYEQPKLGSHHFSIRPWNFVSQGNNIQENIMKPDLQQQADWVTELAKNHEAPDIDLVMLQLNCAVAAEQSVKQLVSFLDTPCKRLSLSSIIVPIYRHFVAATIALLATFFYVFVQAGSYVLQQWPFVHVNALMARFLKLTHSNLRIRCYELTGWPVILLWRGCGRDQPNIAAAHKTALVRHSTWSAIIFDLFFGIVGGVFFLRYHSVIRYLICSMMQSLTDDILRTGCIWLMGVPAGFKLNTELAGVLGLFSLNVIQIWSTLMYLLKPLFGAFLYMLALSGMLLGITVPAAIIADILFLATLHISTLHQLVAFLYSNQLQDLAALWRLFRGRKRNALRGRIDTYDCSVEQHVVGSLMFTPLLLLLPTTSVFYIFFTMLFTSLSIVRFFLQIVIAILHCFPYAQVAIWLVQPRRFPSGILFEALPGVSIKQVAIQPPRIGGMKIQQRKGLSIKSASHSFITLLGIRTASIAEILHPSVKRLAGGLTWSSCALCIYKIFSGERWPSSVELGAPFLPPWTVVSVRRFWWLCYDAVLASI